MSPLWVLPLCVLAVGAVATALAARRLAQEVAALRAPLEALRDLGDDARALGAELDATRSRGRSLGATPARLRASRAAAREARVAAIAR